MPNSIGSWKQAPTTKHSRCATAYLLHDMCCCVAWACRFLLFQHWNWFNLRFAMAGSSFFFSFLFFILRQAVALSMTMMMMIELFYPNFILEYRVALSNLNRIFRLLNASKCCCCLCLIILFYLFFFAVFTIRLIWAPAIGWIKMTAADETFIDNLKYMYFFVIFSFTCITHD